MVLDWRDKLGIMTIAEKIRSDQSPTPRNWTYTDSSAQISVTGIGSNPRSYIVKVFHLEHHRMEERREVYLHGTADGWMTSYGSRGLEARNGYYADWREALINA